MESNLLLLFEKKEQLNLPLLCHLAKKITPTPSLISEIFLPFFNRLSTYEYEIQVELSKIYGIHGSKEHNACWLNNTKLIPVVAHHWLISQLMINPQEAIRDNATYQIKNALHHINCNTRQQLEELLQTLTLQKNIYDYEILKLLESGIQNGKLTYELSEKILHYLLRSTQYEMVFSACELMKKHPFIFSNTPEVSLRIVMQRGGLYEPLALQTLGTWGNNRIFEEVILIESWQLESKRAVLPFLPLTTSLMDTLSQNLTLYPNYSEDWLESLLRGADQGTYISKKRIVKLVQHYFDYEFITTKQLVQLIDEKSKKELFNLSVKNNDYDFQKRIKLYQELKTPYARKKIVAHLKEIEDSTQLTILLEPIAELKITEAESFIFPHIQHHPKICLETLKYIGGTKTIAYLKELLEFDVPVKQNIPSFEKEALALLADLVSDQHVIINYLQKHKLPHICLPNLYLTPSTVNESYLLQILDKEEINNVQYGIEKLGELGTIEALEPVIKKIGMMAPDYSKQEWESVTTNIAWEASQKIVNRAYNQHKIRAKNSNKRTVVNTVLAEVLLKQFEKSLSDADATHYLNYISEVIPSGFPLEKLSILASSTNPHVIKFYISYLSKINTDTAIKQLKEELKITQNIYTLKQALLSITELRNSSLEKLVIPLLEHPNMNIKKTVAAYLTGNGTVKAVPAMMHLFRKNDNTGLRAELEKGLKNILGDTYFFFLFNECFSCEVAWQRQLLENTITNDNAITEEHYIDFPELIKIVPRKKIVPNPKKNLELISKWETIRSRTKEDLSQFEKGKDLISNIETIKQKADFVFITDLIAASLRKLGKTPLSKSFKTILTSEEARIEITENGTNTFLWDTLLLDPENEQIEYNNIINYKEDKKKEKLFFHFLAHYGLQNIISKLIEENKIGFLNKLLSNNKTVLHPKYLPLLITYHNTLKSREDENIIASLETFITNHSFASKNHQKICFFETATADGKVNRLASYNAQQQSLLKEEIIQLYKITSWKQRNALLQTIKAPRGHTALFELSFAHYLEGKITSYSPLNTSQILKFERHPKAIEQTKKASYRLPYHCNEFILAYVKEVTSDQEADPALLYPFRQLSSEQKWEILKNELEQGNWYWFSFFNSFSPINTKLKKWLKKAQTEGKIEFIKSLINTNKPIYFPNFEEELLLLVKESREPIVWQLLFNLQSKKNEKKLIAEFTCEYVDYSTSMRIKLLSHLLHTIPDSFVHSSIFETLVPTDKKEQILLLQLQLKTLDYKTVDADIVIGLIKQLAMQDIALAKKSLTEVLDSRISVGLEKQMKILSACYSITALNDTVTTQIALLFSTERLALSFLTEELRTVFNKQIGVFFKVNNMEIDKKRLLKDLADESPEEIKQLLMNILSSKKRTELDTLCLRLLKKTSSKAFYLETCYTLLSSEKENLFQSILRTLSFASYSAAIPTFIKLLSHKTFSNDARNGLLVFGEEAIPLLTKAVNKVRPDKRNILNELLAEVKSSI